MEPSFFSLFTEAWDPRLSQRVSGCAIGAAWPTMSTWGSLGPAQPRPGIRKRSLLLLPRSHGSPICVRRKSFLCRLELDRSGFLPSFLPLFSTMRVFLSFPPAFSCQHSRQKGQPWGPSRSLWEQHLSSRCSTLPQCREGWRPLAQPLQLLYTLWLSQRHGLCLPRFSSLTSPMSPPLGSPA